jgi:hypothetical protein
MESYYVTLRSASHSLCFPCGENRKEIGDKSIDYRTINDTRYRDLSTIISPKIGSSPHLLIEGIFIVRNVSNSLRGRFTLIMSTRLSHRYQPHPLIQLLYRPGRTIRLRIHTVDRTQKYEPYHRQNELYIAV